MTASVRAVSSRVANSLSERAVIVVVTILFLAISLVAVSHESFWIDEFGSLYFGSQPSVKAMWQELIRFRWPELQAPLYMLHTWLWQRLFGPEEWVMRLAGVPWFVLGAVSFVHAFPSKSERVCAFCVVAFSPFAWFYLNEARLYSMLLGFTFLLLAALIHLKRAELNNDNAEQRRWLFVFAWSLSLMSALTVLGMIWASAAVLVLPALFSLRTLVTWLREHWLLLGATALLLMMCAGYYVWTRSLGARATNVAASNWQSFSFIAYEMLGFNGLGPGRLALREGGVSELKPWLLLLGIYGVALLLIGSAAILELHQRRALKKALLIAIALGFPASIFIAIALLMNFRLLGRHCTPLVGMTTLVFGLGACRLWEDKRWWARGGLLVFLGLSIVSCFTQRFAHRHAKDDYRGAANLARAGLERGQSVWWNADSMGCAYYKLPSSKDSPTPGKVWLVSWPATDFAHGVAKPDLVFVSKPDVYDPHGVLQDYLKKEGYLPVERLPAFVVFEPSPGGSAANSKAAVQRSLPRHL
jgi:uncharacterized membrane protein